MQVTPIEGEKRRFHVSSESGNEPYLVDLDENGGLGRCGCIHHEKRIQPAIDKGESAPSCKHLAAAFRYEERRKGEKP